MPILKKAVPQCNSKIRAEEIMNPDVVALSGVDSVENIFKALQTSHHGFPVLNKK
jgi:predicted transcriptional regulator